MPKRRAKKKSRKWLLIVSTGVILLLGASLGLYFYLTSVSNSGVYAVGSPVPERVYAPFYSAAHDPYGPANSSFSQFFSGYRATPYVVDGKPVVVFVGAEPCSLCAAERWPLILALMRFGNFTHLRLMVSPANPQAPEVATFTFHGSAYSSSYLVFQGYEIADVNAKALDVLPTSYATDWRVFNQSVPFLNFGNQYVLRGNFPPTVLGGKNWTQIVSMIHAGDQVGEEIRQLANGMTAAICAIDGGLPSDVCSDQAITGFILISLPAPQGGAQSPPAEMNASVETQSGAAASSPSLDVAIPDVRDLLQSKTAVF